jgi:GNAT superfamily N-acetyltransferase
MEYCIATEHDVEQLARMRWDFRTEDDEAPVMDQAEFIESCVAYLKQSLETDSWTYWIAKDRDEIVSHIFVYIIQAVPKPSSFTNCWGYMTNVYTKPAYRNKGIGSELMRHVKHWVKEQGLRLLIVSPSEASVPFYARAGFRSETEWMELEFEDTQYESRT